MEIKKFPPFLRKKNYANKIWRIFLGFTSSSIEPTFSEKFNPHLLKIAHFKNGRKKFPGEKIFLVLERGLFSFFPFQNIPIRSICVSVTIYFTTTIKLLSIKVINSFISFLKRDFSFFPFHFWNGILRIFLPQ
jgi:hypothetical protein